MKKNVFLTGFAALMCGVTTLTAQVGINTEKPATTLDIEQTDSTTNPGHGLKLADGTQGTGKVITSDANGVGDWQYPALQMIIGTLGAGVDIPWVTTSNDPSASLLYTGSSITLPPGMWKVEVAMLLYVAAVTVPDSVSDFSANNWLWVRTSFSDSPTTLALTPDLSGTTVISAMVRGPLNGILPVSSANTYGMLEGYLIINNTSGAPKTYYYYVNNCYSSALLPASGSFKISIFGCAHWQEDRIIAEPVKQ